MRSIRVGARRSALAVAQAELIATWLRAGGHDTEVVGITTRGDVDRRHLTEIGGSGVFAVAVRDGLHRGDIDVAVHSMKDLPVAEAPGLRIGAIPIREDSRDVLVGTTVDRLRDGMVIGTGSPRRQVQLAAYAEARGVALTCRPIRGNVGTRIKLVADGELDATVLAAAGLSRLNLIDAEAVLGSPTGIGVLTEGPTVQVLDHDVVTPAAAQGALAVEVSATAPEWIVAAVTALDHGSTRAAVTAEREFLATLEAGCLAPVGVAARVRNGHDMGTDLTLSAVIGRTVVSTLVEPANSGALLRVEGAGSCEEAAALGRRLARTALTRMEPQAE